MGVLPKYDIFSGIYGDEDVLWLEPVESLGNACERMKELARQRRGPYFVFCMRTHRVLAQIDTTTAAEPQQPKRASV